MSTNLAEAWMPRERWDALVRGEDCPFCRDVAGEAAVDDHGYLIADLQIGRLRLAANQIVPGYCILICRRHVREPYELDRADRVAFFDDLMTVAQTLDRLFNATKINDEILGNLIPHLHAHILPRTHGDPHPNRPYPFYRESRGLTEPEYAARVARIRAALAGG